MEESGKGGQDYTGRESQRGRVWGVRMRVWTRVLDWVG